MATPRILIILTSCDRLARIGPPTGFRLADFTAAWAAFSDAGYELTLASPLGGAPPVDPVHDRLGNRTDATRRFLSDREARDALADTLCLDQIHAGDFDALFCPGGTGVPGDLIGNPLAIALLTDFAAAGKPMGFVAEARQALPGDLLPGPDAGAAPPAVIHGNLVMRAADAAAAARALIALVQATSAS